MIDAYEKGYSEGLSEYIKEIKYIGYSAAFGNANGNPSYTEDERKWYNEGLNEGNAKLKEIKEEAKKLGFEGKDESVLDKFTEGKTQALEAFKIGEEERLKQEQIKKEKENKMNLFKYGMIIAMGITTVSIGFVLNKMKKSRTNEAIDDNVA